LSFINKRITLNLKNKSVEAILDQILDQSNLTYRIFENNLIVVTPEVYVRQGITITGRVTDNAGEPLPGVNVMVKGTNIGSIANAAGGYSITVPNSDATLVFSFLGFATQEIAVADRQVIDVTMSEDVSQIDEVVVVGYGVQRRVNLTGSVSTIAASKLENRATPNLSTSLTGLAAGVTVRQGSGNPGSDGANIRVRGVGTFSGDYRGPMVIVDGVEGSMDAVNMNDVESVSILKDAASASIYGSRGANGVVLITTKKGRRDATPSVTYSGIFSVTQPSTKHKFLWDYAEYMDLMNMAQRATNPTGQLIYDPAEIDEWRAAKNDPNGKSKFRWDDGFEVPNYLAYPNTDWASAIFENWFAQNHNLSVSGGSSNTAYLLSLGYMNNPGVMQNTGIDRYQFRINMESQINKFIKIGTQTFAMRQDKEQGDSGNALVYLFQQMAGAVPIYDGKYGGQTATADPSTTNNLLRLLNLRDGNERTYRLNSTWFASVNILSGLTFDARFNYQARQINIERWPLAEARYNFRTGLPVENAILPSAATIYRNSIEDYRYITNFLLNYHNTFGNHSVSGLLGYEQMYYNYKGFNATRIGFLDMEIHDITTASEMQNIDGDYERDYAMISYFGRINYAYKDKYLFEANFRRDASSRFSPDNRWGTFPSVSAGWRVSEEDFFTGVKTIVNYLKLRASWGKLGNTTSGYYDWQATYGRQNNSFGDVIANGLGQTKIANPLLQWENVTSSEVGLEAAFLNHRLNTEVGFYNKLTEGILTSPAIFATMGTAGAPTKNTSDMRNRGVEVALTWNDKAGDFRYSTTVNFAYNVNKVMKYLGKLERGWEKDNNDNDVYTTNIGQVATMSGNNITLEDYSYSEYFLRTVYKGTGTYANTDGTVDINGGPKDGMIRTPDDLQWVRDMIDAGYSFQGVRTITANGLNYGELIYADPEGDKNYGNDNSRIFTGKSDIPKYTLGFTASAEWKGIDLNMTWAGNFGMWYFLRERGINQRNISQGNVIPHNARNMFYYYNANDPNDPNNNINAAYPRLLYNTDGTHTSSDFYLYDASYLKLKFLQLGYTLPKSFTNKAYINKLRVFVSGENLLTFTNYPGMDPEIGSGVNVYPISRVLSCGINITF